MTDRDDIRRWLAEELDLKLNLIVARQVNRLADEVIRDKIQEAVRSELRAMMTIMKESI
jgi:hypothetical protein